VTPAPRSYLFVPGDRPERFAKALASGADAIVLDLEDAVAPAAKPAARAAIAAWLASSPDAHRAVVRINDESTPWFADDLALLAAQGAAALMLPKAERIETLATLRAQCPQAGVLALIESARGVLAAPALAAAPGVQRLVFGTLDYALDLDLDLDAWPEPIALDAAATAIALASRAAGLAAPVAGVTVQIDDETRLRSDLARARALGFGAKLCIHPRQVDGVHTALSPSADDIAWARRVMAAVSNAGDPLGVLQLDGRMVDRPVIERARRLLARARP
jgi:citrate lyase subunit beta/citryl-CoA lyase